MRYIVIKKIMSPGLSLKYLNLGSTNSFNSRGLILLKPIFCDCCQKHQTVNIHCLSTFFRGIKTEINLLQYLFHPACESWCNMSALEPGGL